MPPQILRDLMDDRRAGKWWPMGLIVIALIVWGGMLALGTYLEPAADRPEHDLRKPLIVLASVGGFLAFWGLALWFRQRSRDR